MANRPSLWWLLVLGAFVGCRPETRITEEGSETQYLRNLVAAYMQTATDLGRMPRSIVEIKPALKCLGDPEQLVRSPRDGQIYVLVTGGQLDGHRSETSAVLAYERAGVDGSRLVVDSQRRVWEVTEEEFAKLSFPTSHHPPRSSVSRKDPS